MRALREIKIGIRLQSSIIIFLVAFWWSVAWMNYHTHIGIPNVFWPEAFLCLPVLTFILATFLLFTHIKRPQSYPLWVYPAILAVASQWLWFWMMFFFAGL
jgi:hypothetical protein